MYSAGGKELKVKVNRVLLLLLIVGGYWYRLFEVSPTLLGHSRLYSILAVFVFVVLLTQRSTYLKFKAAIKRKNKLSSTFFAYLLIVLYAAVSVFWAYSRHNAMIGVVAYLTTGLVIFEAAILINDISDFYFCCKVLTFNVFIIAAMAVYECLTGSYIFSLTSSVGVLQWMYAGLHSPIVQYNHPNNLSTVLLLSYPFCVIALRRGKTKHTLALIFLTIVLFVIIVASNSRFALAVFVLYFVFSIFFLGNKKKRYLYVVMLVLLGLFALIYMNSILSSIEFQAMGLSDEARPVIWKNALNNFVNSGGLGVGVGNAETVNAMTAHADYIGRPCHNQILEILEELGVFGLLVWLVWYVNTFKNSYRVFKTERNTASINVFIFVIIFVLMTIQQSSMLGSYSVWLPFGIVIGFCNLQERKIIKGK